MPIETSFTTFPTLTTARMVLRQVQAEDAEALFAIKSDAQVTAQYGQEPHHSLVDTLRWIERLQADYPRRESLFWTISLIENGRVIGGCPYWNFSGDHRVAEIGYELHPSFWNQGYMSEALKAILDYGFGEMELHRVEATPFADNLASCALLEKMGFTYEGRLRERHAFGGKFLDQLYYGLLAKDWG
jgi:[ribosomal protein S5]-alanine N-acetyltransferase